MTEQEQRQDVTDFSKYWRNRNKDDEKSDIEHREHTKQTTVL